MAVIPPGAVAWVVDGCRDDVQSHGRGRPPLRSGVVAARRKTDKPSRSKATFDLPADLLAELRAASVSIPPRAFGGSLSGLAERVLRRELEALRRKHNGGRPFKAKEPVRRGRPPKL